MQKNLIIVLILAIIIGVFALSNSEPVEIDFVFAKLEMSQAIVIFISVLLGALVAITLGVYREYKLKKSIKDLKLEISNLETEIERQKSELATKEKQMKLMYANKPMQSVKLDENNEITSN